MKITKLYYGYLLSLFMLFTFVMSYAFAESSVTAPQDFLAQVLKAIAEFGGLPTVLKIASIITLIVGSMKVSVLNEMLWSKLGAAKVYVAPVLGLIAGILGLGSNGPITAASVFAYVASGAGAVILHEILDSIKAIPGLGEVYISIINLIESFLGGPGKK